MRVLIGSGAGGVDPAALGEPRRVRGGRSPWRTRRLRHQHAAGIARHGDSLPGTHERDMDRPDDEGEIVARVQRGEREAFGVLMRRHAQRAYAVAYRVLRHNEDAEDVVQESFVAALDGIDTFEIGRPFAPWLLRIVMYRSINARRSRMSRERHVLAEPADAASGVGALTAPERSEIRTRFGEALRGLPEQQRLVVQLSDVDGYSSQEIGDMLDMPSGTVRWHLHTARTVLRRVLAPLRGEAGGGGR
jgi:RNA polymerase sigma-70 factor, ECF subfamily